jgi:hypothetical protein
VRLGLLEFDWLDQPIAAAKIKGDTVTIKRMGSTKLYSEGWEKAFGKSRRSAGAATKARPARSKSKRKAAR